MTYSKLVKKAQREIKNRKEYKAGKLELHSCKEWEKGNQINLWTYWQGFQLKDIDKKGVDILLVGLDWGNPHKKENKRLMEEIVKTQKGVKNAKYIAESPTDRRLKKMFLDSFGVNIMDNNPKLRLFFTNYSLGYRGGDRSESGGNSKTLLNMDKELFDELVLTIKPKIIICLGKLPYEMVSETVTKDFVQHLREGIPFETQYPYNKEIMVYGVAHPGSWGLKNLKNEDTMLEAWKKIGKEFKKKHKMEL